MPVFTSQRATFWIFLFPCDSVESTESIEFEANYGKTQFNTFGS